jgi:hypothetical protein
MLPAALENYLFEIARVLKPGGRCFATFFLWNHETAALVGAGRSLISFPYDQGIYRVLDNRVPEAAVAYHDAHVISLLNKYGLEVHGPVHYGAWSGRQPSHSTQDIIVTVRTRAHGAKKPRQSARARLATRMARARRLLAAGVRDILQIASLGRRHKNRQLEGWQSIAASETSLSGRQRSEAG